MENNYIKIKTSPLSRVVAAAAIDMYENFGTVQHRYQHWAARGLKKLEGESLKKSVRSAVLRISRNTKTAVLPCGFDDLIFVGIIDRMGRKISMKLDNSLV